MPLSPRGFTPRQNAAIAGVALVITSLLGFWNLHAASRYAAEAASIVAHPQQFRLMVLFDLMTVAGCLVLNAALYELLAPVHRSLARFAAFWRLAESAIYASATVHSVLALALLTRAGDAGAFSTAQLHALARMLRSGHAHGFSIAMIFLSLGSAVYMVLLFRSRWVPRILSVIGLIVYGFGIPAFLAHVFMPGSFAAAASAVRGLPILALIVLAILALPLVLFEVSLGLWLLVKGVPGASEEETR